jgi:hypothetical protein
MLYAESILWVYQVEQHSIDRLQQFQLPIIQFIPFLFDPEKTGV